MEIVPNPEAVAAAKAWQEAQLLAETESQAELARKASLVEAITKIAFEYDANHPEPNDNVVGVKAVLAHRGVPLVILGPELFDPKGLDSFLVYQVGHQNENGLFFYTKKVYERKFDGWKIEPHNHPNIGAVVDKLWEGVTVVDMEALCLKYYLEAEAHPERYPNSTEQMYAHCRFKSS